MLLIGLAGSAAQLTIETVWVLGAGTLRDWFAREPRRIRVLHATSGGAMLLLAGKLAVERPAT